MVITILAAGSRGDTQPYLALGVELKKAGHAVRMATFEKYADQVAELGLELHALRGDVSAVAASEGVRGAHTADNPLKVLLSFNKLRSFVFDLQKDLFAACQGADAVVYHPGAAIGFFAARHLGIPSILALPFPMTPTRAFPSMIFYAAPRLGRTFNLLTHKFTEKMMWSASKSAIRKFWIREFGRPPHDFDCPFGKQVTNALPTIVSCSNHIFPQPEDWPDGVHNTGAWFLDEEVGWQPPADLIDFLQAGSPPVYMGFGSTGDPTQAAQTSALVVAALQRAGQRGVLAIGWTGMSKLERVPDGIFVLESIPHSWLFPQMAAVVHHGGAGTTAAGLRAGVPSIIIPSSNDHFAWARRIHELGVGPKPIHRKDLSAEGLAQAIRSALSEEIKDAAKEIGILLRQENGTATAVKIILDCLDRKDP